MSCNISYIQLKITENDKFVTDFSAEEDPLIDYIMQRNFTINYFMKILKAYKSKKII